MEDANDSTEAELINAPPMADQVSAPPVFNILSDFEFWLSLSILCFGLIIMLMEVSMIKSKNFSNGAAVKIIVITLIIISTLFLIAAGFNNVQIAPAIGLLGAIAGYLLGKAENESKA